MIIRIAEQSEELEGAAGFVRPGIVSPKNNEKFFSASATPSFFFRI